MVCTPCLLVRILSKGEAYRILKGSCIIPLKVKFHITASGGIYLRRAATLVRLLTINSINAYITSWVLYLSGGSEDRRLLLPAWISIATTLTFCYHLTQRKINIRKETSASISVFSIASFISMVSLLLQLHLTRANDPPVPLFLLAQRVWKLFSKLVMTGIGPVGREL